MRQKKQIQLVLLSCLLLVASDCALPKCEEVFYDHYQLALTWPAEYCSENSCVSNWKDIWDGKSLLIHGFWPSSRNLAFLDCLKKDHDPYCYHSFSFQKSHFNSAELENLRKYWPAIGTIKNFWSYEWDKHGTCYLHIIKDEYESELTTKQIFREYMLSTVDKTIEIGASLKKGKTYNSKKDLAYDLNLHSSQFYAICYKDNELDEIRVCYDVYSVPGLERIDTCPPSSDKSQCSFPIKIK